MAPLSLGLPFREAVTSGSIIYLPDEVGFEFGSASFFSYRCPGVVQEIPAAEPWPPPLGNGTANNPAFKSPTSQRMIGPGNCQSSLPQDSKREGESSSPDSLDWLTQGDESGRADSIFSSYVACRCTGFSQVKPPIYVSAVAPSLTQTGKFNGSTRAYHSINVNQHPRVYLIFAMDTFAEGSNVKRLLCINCHHKLN